MADGVLQAQPVSTPDGRITVFTAGEGRPLWCLHGFPDTADTWFDLAQPLLDAGYALRVPVMPGYEHGSEQADYRLQSLAGVLQRLIRAVDGEQPVFLLGHDWGAALGYALSARPDLDIRALACAAVPHLRRFLRTSPAQLRRSWYMGYFQLPGRPEKRIAADGHAFIEQLWRDWSPGWAFSAEQVAPIKALFDQPARVQAALAYYRALPASVWEAFRPGGDRAILASCPSPTLVLAGEDDGCIGAELFSDQARYFQASYRFRLIEQAGHFMHREQPGQFADAVLEFFGAY